MPLVGSADEQNHWLGLPLGHCSYESVSQHLCLGCHKPLASFLSQIPSVEDSPEIPMGQGQSGAFHKVTHSARGLGCWLSPLDFLSPLEEAEAQGRPHHMVWHWPGGGAMWSTCSISLTCVMRSVMVSVLRWGVGVSASPLCSRILSGVSCSSCDGE